MVCITSGCHQSVPAGSGCVVVEWLFIVGERRRETSVYFIPTAYIFLHLSGSKPKFSKPEFIFENVIHLEPLRDETKGQNLIQTSKMTER